jgi:hypothetical protein
MEPSESRNLGVVEVLRKNWREEILADCLLGPASQSTLGLPLEIRVAFGVLSSANNACGA